MIIDEYLLQYDVASRHQILINASSERVYDAMCTLDMSNSLLARVLLAARSLNFTLSTRKNQLGSTLDALQKNGFILLKSNPPQELVLGLVGKFWTPSGCIRKMDADEFFRFNENGFAKAAWNFHIAQQPDGRTPLNRNPRTVLRWHNQKEVPALLVCCQSLQRIDSQGGIAYHKAGCRTGEYFSHRAACCANLLTDSHTLQARYLQSQALAFFLFQRRPNTKPDTLSRSRSMVQAW